MESERVKTVKLVIENDPVADLRRSRIWFSRFWLGVAVGLAGGWLLWGSQ